MMSSRRLAQEKGKLVFNLESKQHRKLSGEDSRTIRLIRISVEGLCRSSIVRVNKVFHFVDKKLPIFQYFEKKDNNQNTIFLCVFNGSILIKSVSRERLLPTFHPSEKKGC